MVRSYVVSPKDTERFLLQEILRRRPGATSFEDLMTVNNVKYQTYREAAAALGYFENDELWVRTLEEAVLTQCNSSKIREVFAYLLIFGNEVKEPLKLFNQFKGQMGDDFKRKKPNLTDAELDQKVLQEISKVLLEHNKKPSDYDLPKIANPAEFSYSVFSHLSESDHSDFEAAYSLLTPAQKVIFNKVENKLRTRHKMKEKNQFKNAMFIDASGGAGKTTLLNTIIVGMIKKGFNVVSVAHSGIAAILLKNGRTSHSLFKLPLHLQDFEQQYCDIKKGSSDANFLKKIDLIIWDEATMSSKLAFECLDRTLQDLCDCNHLFANKIVLMAGDFRQTLPIVRHGSKEDVIRHSIRQSFIWGRVELFTLTENLRLGGEASQKEFADYLLKIGEDKFEKDENDEIELEQNLISDAKTTEEFLNYFYDKEQFTEENSDQFTNTAILAPLIKNVNELNEMIIDRLASKNERRYYSQDTICKESAGLEIPVETLNKEDQSGLPPHELHLKTGATVMLIRNLNPSAGLCNGTRIRVTELLDHLIKGVIISGKFKKTPVVIPRIGLYSDDQEPIRFKRQQFPLRLAFALTINKAQGQTLEKVGIYLKNPVFSHGQLYVALTRAKNVNGIKVFLDPEKKTKKTCNIVYHEMFN